MRQWLLLAAITAGMLWIASSVQPRYRVQDFFPTDTPERDTFEQVRDSFGRDDRTAIIVLEHTRPLDPELLAAIDRLGLALAERPDVARVFSPAEARVVSEDETGRPVLRRAADVPFAIAEEALRRAPYLNTLLSADRQVAVVGAVMPDDRLDYISRRTLRDALLTLTADYPGTVHLAGYPIHRVVLSETVRAESLRLYPIVLGVMALVLFIGLRSAVGVLAPIVVAAVASVWTAGLMGLTGLPPNILSPGVYVVVAVISVADAVHLLVRRDVQRLIMPCLLTTATTAIGFGALALSGIPMIAHFGLQVAMGVCAAYAVTFLAVPPLLRRAGAAPVQPAVLGLLDRWTTRRPRTIAAAGLVVIGVAAAAAPSIPVNSPLLADLDEDHPVRQTYTLLEERMGGVLPIDVLLTGDHIYDKATLDKVAAFTDRVRRHPDVLNAVSVVDLMQRFGPLLRKVPDAEITSLLPTALLLAHDETRVWVDDETDLMRIRLRVSNLGTDEAFALFADLDAAHQEIFGAPAQLTGQGYLGQTVNRALVDHFQTGFLVALAAVMLLVFVGLRSARLSAAAILPNLLPLAAVIGAMALFGIELRYTSALVLTVVFALAVDDTIHFLAATHAGDVSSAFTHAGPPILLTSAVLGCGFAVLLFSSFLPTQVMGLMLAVTACAAIIGDLLLLPALLRL